MYTVIWATDGSSGAEDALPEARRLAVMGDGKIVVVHCDQHLNGRPGGWSGKSLEHDVEELIRQQADSLREEGLEVEVIVRHSHQDAAETVATVAREVHADVVVCGTRGRTPAASALLGSFTQRLLHVAPCAVLAVPPTAAVAKAGS